MASSSQGLATSSAARRRLGQVSEHLAPSLFEPFVGRTIHTSVPIRRDPPSDPAPGSPPFPSSVSPDNAADARNRPVWQFLTASAFHGKPEMRRQRYDPRCEIPANHPIKRWVDATLSQHPSAGKDRTITGGQDWWFVQPMQSGSGVAMGVADGVGGWSDEGVDPSCVAQGLMYYAAKEAASGFAGEEGWMEEEAAGGEEMVPQWSNSSGGSSSAASTNTSSGSGPISNTFLDAVQFAQPQQQPPTPRSDPRPPPTPTAMARKKDPRTVHPHELLAKSYDFVMRDPGIHGGASTSLVATMNSRSGVLRWANLGDSGLLVLRNYKVIKQSRIQTHFFNCPYQLTKIPHGTRRRPGTLQDEPRQASLDKFQLQDGDLVVLFTDGYGDNIHNVETEKAAKIVMESEDTESGQMAPESSGEPEDAFQSESEGLAGGTRAPIGARPEPLSEEKKLERLAYMLCYLARMVSFSADRVTPFEVEARQNGIHDLNGGKVDDITVIVTLVRER